MAKGTKKVDLITNNITSYSHRIGTFEQQHRPEGKGIQSNKQEQKDQPRKAQCVVSSFFLGCLVFDWVESTDDEKMILE